MADITLPTPQTPSAIDLRSTVTGVPENSPIIWLRDAGAPDETSRLELPSSIRSTVSPMVTALRWGAVLYGMPKAMLDSVNEGDLWVVATLTIALFLTVWRTFRPLRLAWEGRTDRFMPVVDGLILGAGIGLSGAFGSPFIFCVLAAVVVAVFGWGVVLGAVVLASSIGAMYLTSLFTDTAFTLSQGRLAVMAAMVVSALLVAFARSRLLDAERRRLSLSGQLDVLAETNDLLGILNQVARTLPMSLDMREALGETRSQLSKTFSASTIGLLTRDDQSSTWLPQIADGCSLPQEVRSTALPNPLAQALLSTDSVVVDQHADGAARLNANSNSGLYTALRTRGKVVGLLGLESTKPNAFGKREQRLAEGLAEALALTLDNARSFGRLRTLGADEERTRIARDLHDRLGQWLTYISLELERIMSTGDGDSADLESLYGDVQTAIDELRETLRQLRTDVAKDKPLATVAAEVSRRFGERTGVKVNFAANAPKPLDVRLETEILRILQEAFNNIEKHAAATEVNVKWTVDASAGTMEIEDNGKGFNVDAATRDGAYGLIGMRERADTIGATLAIRSKPNQGSAITVRATSERAI